VNGVNIAEKLRDRQYYSQHSRFSELWRGNRRYHARSTRIFAGQGWTLTIRLTRKRRCMKRSTHFAFCPSQV
jgi:hypothetical protein